MTEPTPDLKAQRVPLKGGREFDAFTWWRETVFWQAGELKGIKRRYNRRWRRMVRAVLKRSSNGSIE